MMRTRMRGISVLVAFALWCAGGAFSALAEERPASPIPFKSDVQADGTDTVRVMTGLVICAAIFAGYVYVMRRRMGKGQSPSKREAVVLDSRRLSANAMLHVVEFDGKKYLLAQNANCITCVASAPGKQAAAEGQS